MNLADLDRNIMDLVQIENLTGNTVEDLEKEVLAFSNNCHLLKHLYVRVGNVWQVSMAYVTLEHWNQYIRMIQEETDNDLEN